MGVSKAAVVAKMKELNVQLDNLCQVRRRVFAASPSTH